MKNILVVDKTPSVHRIRDIAQRMKVNMMEAGTSNVALRKLREAKYDVELIIIDVMLEGEDDGFDLIGKIKDEAPSIPIVILTSEGKKREIVRGLKLGVADYILKPFEDSTIENRVFSNIESRDRLFDKTKKADHEEIKGYIHAELMKSKKGKYPITVLAAVFYDADKVPVRGRTREYGHICEKFMEKIRPVFFETDYVTVFEANTLVAVLPFCPKENLGIIDAKLEKKSREVFELLELSNSKMSVAYMSSTDECFNKENNEECMLERIFQEIDALIMLGKFSRLSEETYD